MKSTLYLCGAGNPEGVRLALRINEKQKRWGSIVMLDDDPAKKGASIMGVEIAGPFVLLRQADRQSAEVVNLVARTTEKRRAAYRRLEPYGIPFASLIDPNVDTWGVEWSGDVTVYQNVVLSAGALLAQGAVIFTGAVVGHGCRVGPYCVVAPGAVLNARVRLGEGVYVGTNASMLPDLEIGPWATIGLNTGVIENVPAGATALGVPAQVFGSGVPGAAPGPVEETPASLLPEPSASAPSREETERLIMNVWGTLLDKPAFGLDDSFFDLGGTSVLATQAHLTLRECVCGDLTLIDIFRCPTARALADLVAKRRDPPGRP